VIAAGGRLARLPSHNNIQIFGVHNNSNWLSTISRQSDIEPYMIQLDRLDPVLMEVTNRTISPPLAPCELISSHDMFMEHHFRFSMWLDILKDKLGFRYDEHEISYCRAGSEYTIDNEEDWLAVTNSYRSHPDRALPEFHIVNRISDNEDVRDSENKPSRLACHRSARFRLSNPAARAIVKSADPDPTTACDSPTTVKDPGGHSRQVLS
jgi:hypothetical protein